MRSLFIAILVIGGLIPGPGAGAQDDSISGLVSAELSLYKKFTELYKSADDSKRQELNREIMDEFEILLKTPASFQYPFDSLRQTGRIYSPDHVFRLITWNIPSANGTHACYGFIQYRQKANDPCTVIRLHDRSAEISNPESALLSPDRWWGALYYEILVNKFRGARIYTLIGLDLNDQYSNKKVIEILTFDDQNRPVFGRPLFRLEKKVQNRVIFEYAEDVVMTVRYHDIQKMIVFDHLSPIEPALRNNPRFYAPDSSYDGFMFRKGSWEYQPDLDVRNP